MSWRDTVRRLLQVFGKRLLTSLTEAFGRMIFGAGFVHGDPHPGNIFIMDGGQVALIDCGQARVQDSFCAN